jgi:hypothetical protein
MSTDSTAKDKTNDAENRHLLEGDEQRPSAEATQPEETNPHSGYENSNPWADR